MAEWLARKHEYHTEHPRDFDFWCVASCHDDGRCDGECDPDCESCPVECPLCSTPPAPDPDRLRALEAALERIEDLLRLREDGSTPTGETMVMAWNVARRALLAEGERSE